MVALLMMEPLMVELPKAFYITYMSGLVLPFWVMLVRFLFSDIHRDRYFCVFL